MATNLTGSTIASSYSQLLHLDGGPTATPKVVYSGTGTATAMKLGTISVEFDNIKLDGNTISSTDTNGNLNFTPNGTGSVVIPKVTFSDQSQARTALALGTMATQNSGAVSITGGTLSGVVFTGSFSGLTLVESTTLATSAAAAGVNLNGNTLGADGTDTNIDINLIPKGTGEVNITNVDILSGKVPFNTLTNRAYASFSDITDQTGSATVPTAVKFDTAEIVGAGITMVTDGTNLTRMTFAAAGTYAIMPSLQLSNSDSAEHDVSIWISINGTDVPRSATRITVSKIADGGVGFFQITYYVTVTTGQYVQIFWLPENIAVRLEHTAAVTGPPAIPAIPSSIMSVERIA